MPLFWMGKCPSCPSVPWPQVKTRVVGGALVEDKDVEEAAGAVVSPGPVAVDSHRAFACDAGDAGVMSIGNLTPSRYLHGLVV